jgi:DNA-binding transcriptional LysR family regulator
MPHLYLCWKAALQSFHRQSLHMRIAYLVSVTQQYLNGALRKVRRSHPETVLKLVNLTPGEQIVALRAGEIDIGITNESGELLAGEFYTRELAETGSYIALPEQHRLATRDRVRLSDLRGEFFLSWDSQQVPGFNRRVEAYCKKYGKFRPKFHGPARSLAHGFELIANDNAILVLPAFASHFSTPGVVILPLADADVTWKILVIWRRGRVGGALKTLVDALCTKVSPKANQAKGQGAPVPRESTDRRADPLFAFTGQ